MNPIMTNEPLPKHPLVVAGGTFLGCLVAVCFLVWGMFARLAE